MNTKEHKSYWNKYLGLSMRTRQWTFRIENNRIKSGNTWEQYCFSTMPVALFDFQSDVIEENILNVRKF